MGRIWAVAAHTVREATRMKVVLAVACLTVVLVFVLPFAVRRPDGAVSATVQAFLSWSLRPTATLLTFLAIFLGCLSISDEMANHQIFTLVSKPLPRWQYILGKWLGANVVLTLMLLIAGAVIYLMVLCLDGQRNIGRWADLALLGLAGAVGVYTLAYLIHRRLNRRRQAHWMGTLLLWSWLICAALGAIRLTNQVVGVHVNPDAIDAGILQNEVLTARVGVPLAVPDFTADAVKQYDLLRDEGRIEKQSDKEREKIIALLRQGMQQRWRMVAPGEARAFEFQGIMRGFLDDSDILQLRYKAKGLGYAQDEILQSYWRFGDLTKARQSPWIGRRDVMERYHTIPFQAAAVARDGTLRVEVLNADNLDRSQQHRGATMSFEAQQGFEVLYQVGTFEGNMIRTLFLIWCRVSLIAAVAVCCATLVSYPVACLMSFVFYVLSAVGDYVQDALSFGKKGSGPLGITQYWVEPILKLLFGLFPSFKTYDGVETFVEGRNVSLIWDLEAFFYLVLLLTGLFLMTACLIFRRRQVAELSI